MQLFIESSDRGLTEKSSMVFIDRASVIHSSISTDGNFFSNSIMAICVGAVFAFYASIAWENRAYAVFFSYLRQVPVF